MGLCKYSGNVCRAEGLMREFDPKAANKLVKKYCNDGKENCNQFRFIEDSGIGAGYDYSRNNRTWAFPF